MAEQQTPAPVALCGVRIERSGSVLFVDANGHDVVAGQIVVVELAGEEALAVVVFGPAQLLSNEPRVSPIGRVLRVATDAETIGFEGRSATVNGVQAAGLPPAWAEWLVGPGQEPRVRVAIDDTVPLAGEFIERLFSQGEPSS